MSRQGAPLLEELDAELLVDELELLDDDEVELLEEVVLLVELLLEEVTPPPDPPAPPLPPEEKLVAPPAAPEEDDEDVAALAPLLELTAVLVPVSPTTTCGPQAARASASAA